MSTTRRVLVLGLLAAAVVGLVSWAVVRYLAATSPPASPQAVSGSSPDGAATRRIKSTLFYVAEDGLRLVPVERDVVFAESTTEQAKRIVEAQLERAPAPFASAIPDGTTLRGLYVTEAGEAYVDVSDTMRSQHPGGSLNEIFTVYTVVSVLTTNLPAISSVQILIDGHEVDTLAGHVDLRRPLPRAAQWLERPPLASAPQAAQEPARR
jgi:spore germination protein GerM